MGIMEFVVAAQARKSGNSLVVTLPAHACAVLGIEHGDYASLTIRKIEGDGIWKSKRKKG